MRRTARLRNRRRHDNAIHGDGQSDQGLRSRRDAVGGGPCGHGEVANGLQPSSKGERVRFAAGKLGETGKIMRFLTSHVGKFDMCVEDDYAASCAIALKTPSTLQFSLALRAEG